MALWPEKQEINLVSGSGSAENQWQISPSPIVAGHKLTIYNPAILKSEETINF